MFEFTMSEHMCHFVLTPSMVLRMSVASLASVSYQKLVREALLLGVHIFYQDCSYEETEDLEGFVQLNIL